MSIHFWLTEAQIERRRPFFPKSYGKPRIDDQCVLSGTIFFNRNGLRCFDVLREYGPHKTFCNRWKRWGDLGAFARVIDELDSKGSQEKSVLIDATYLKAHRTASGLRAKKARIACRA